MPEVGEWNNDMAKNMMPLQDERDAFEDVVELDKSDLTSKAAGDMEDWRCAGFCQYLEKADAGAWQPSTSLGFCLKQVVKEQGHRTRSSSTSWDSKEKRRRRLPVCFHLLKGLDLFKQSNPVSETYTMDFLMDVCSCQPSLALFWVLLTVLETDWLRHRITTIWYLSVFCHKHFR